MKKFEIPQYYRSSFITKIKNSRKSDDPRKKDYTPTILDFGPIRFYLARHFGFCYGVENAIDIAYRTIEENPGKRIFLLSEMIHNPGVNTDLEKIGVKFIMDTNGEQLISWDELNSLDIVIIPAFGTTLEIEKILNEKGIDPYRFNTTCPFVEKVWNRSSSLGDENFTVVIHGKSYHEETRATFSHSRLKSPSIIVKDIEETEDLGDFILGLRNRNEFNKIFEAKFSDGFNFEEDLQRIGVVNQSTMLATETQEITDYLKNVMIKKYGVENINDHFADTRDTLCYATNDNQQATYGLLDTDADIAIVVGGYNSSNTGHIVELCERRFPTYFISSQNKVKSIDEIQNFDIHHNKEKITTGFIPDKKPLNIAITSGASCPDSVVEEVIRKIISLSENVRDLEKVIDEVT
jgi:4-hydroxy-3-methylbut-2-enyl diphosphate reductase